MTEKIDGVLFGKMIIASSAALELKKQLINDLNVFPVPDGDTGTNMSLTLSSAALELSKNENALIGKSAEVTARALLRGARGNSGVILSLLFRGFSRALKDKDAADSFDIAAALSEGVDAAYNAVMKPAEGTILTVSRIMANAAINSYADFPDIEAFLVHLIEIGSTALAETMYQNPVLKKAGVVDAGAKGFITIIEGMLSALTNTALEAPLPELKQSPQDQADFSDFDTGDITFAYCTEFIVNRENDKDPSLLRGFLSELGDCIVVVDDDEIIKVHVHTNCPGVVLTEALTYGNFATVKVENMRLQHTEKVLNESELQNSDSNKDYAEPEKHCGVVAVCSGEGLSALFTDLGADGIITGGQTMNPSTDDILTQINRTPAETVFVLPNNKNIIMAAQQCIDLTSKKVIVIPTISIPQGISAMLAIEDSLSDEEIASAMEAAAAKVTTVSITYAARDSEFDGNNISEGDYLALLESKLLTNSPELSAIYAAIADALSDCSPEFLTILYGKDVSESEAQVFGSFLTEKFPNSELTVLSGGQPIYYYLISAE